VATFAASRQSRIRELNFHRATSYKSRLKSALGSIVHAPDPPLSIFVVATLVLHRDIKPANIFVTTAIEDSPHFLPGGELVFRAIEGGSNSL